MLIVLRGRVALISLRGRVVLIALAHLIERLQQSEHVTHVQSDSGTDDATEHHSLPLSRT